VHPGGHSRHVVPLDRRPDVAARRDLREHRLGAGHQDELHAGILIPNLRVSAAQPFNPIRPTGYHLRMDQDFPQFMVRVQHERGRSPEETGLAAYEYLVSDEYSDFGAYEDQVLFKADA